LGHRAPEVDRPGRGGYKAALGDCPNSCGGVTIDQGGIVPAPVDSSCCAV
jgi:hypothetical protein